MLSNKQWASKIEKNKGEVKEKIKEAKEMAEKLDKSSETVVSVILNEGGEISIVKHSWHINPKEIDDRKAIYIYAFYPEYLEEIKDFDIDEFLEMKISGLNWQAR